MRVLCAVPPERAAAARVALVRADRQAIQLYTTTFMGILYQAIGLQNINRIYI